MSAFKCLRSMFLKTDTLLLSQHAPYNVFGCTSRFIDLCFQPNLQNSIPLRSMCTPNPYLAYIRTKGFANSESKSQHLNPSSDMNSENKADSQVHESTERRKQSKSPNLTDDVFGRLAGHHVKNKSSDQDDSKIKFTHDESQVDLKTEAELDKLLEDSLNEALMEELAKSKNGEFNFLSDEYQDLEDAYLNVQFNPKTKRVETKLIKDGEEISYED